jgi:MoaA/NifB/PqqE/SkfB family radical SAM enzyme/ubiquinone/menaquinone biosynthesis C-methylase UbiE
MTGTDYFVRIASRPPLNKVHPQVGSFFREYLKNEKAVEFDGRLVLNTHFPPFPGRAFDRMAGQMIEAPGERRLFSVTLAVTNRCPLKCGHCYNAGRSQSDIPLAQWCRLAARLQELGAVMITLTGGEPLLREDIVQIVRGFDDRSCVNLGTSGWGLTDELAGQLKEAGLFAAGISLDSIDELEHDRHRGKRGSFRAALQAVGTAAASGLYPYFVKMAEREFLRPEVFWRYLEFARDAGAREVHLLEPCAVGRLAGDEGITLRPAERERIKDFQKQAAAREDLPVVSTFTYLEGEGAFGCGAGITHLYVDGSGEVSPCNLVPLSFGNILERDLDEILASMAEYFRTPRTSCVGNVINRHTWGLPLPTPPEVTRKLCDACLPQENTLPAFFRIRSEATKSAGARELAETYDFVQTDYDDFWVVEAGGPVRELASRMELQGDEKVFEAGCGTGFGTELLAGRLVQGGRVIAVDISEGMQEKAKQRLAAAGLCNVDYVLGDALAALERERGLDAIFTSWVLGYIPVDNFLAAAGRALKKGGKLGIIVHRENSPEREFGIFSRLVAEDPSVMRYKVAFDFPPGTAALKHSLQAAGLAPESLWEGNVIFRYGSAQAVMDHLLKSGAGTVFYEAIEPGKREALRARFLEELCRLNKSEAFEVRHDYVGCMAVRE